MRLPLRAQLPLKVLHAFHEDDIVVTGGCGNGDDEEAKEDDQPCESHAWTGAQPVRDVAGVAEGLREKRVPGLLPRFVAFLPPPVLVFSFSRVLRLDLESRAAKFA